MNQSHDFTSHNTQVYHQALSAFRRRRRLRAVAVSARVIAAGAVLAIAWFLRPPPATPIHQVAAVSAPNPAPALSPAPEPHLLSDEQLIAKFPPGSCFLAEVDGKKILLFRDAALRKQFLE